MASLIALTALGLAGYYLAPEYSSNEKTQVKNALELREASNYGFLRGTNTARTAIIASEETRVVRTPTYNKGQVLENAQKSWLYQKEKNDMIANMNNGAAILINRGTIRPSTQKKPGLLQLPTREGDWESAFGDIANASFDIDSGLPPDQMTTNWRDQYGDAGGFPRDGRPRVVLNELYTGNPWGVGGQLFEAVGNQYRDPKFADHPPKDPGILPDETPAIYKVKKRVQFSKYQS